MTNNIESRYISTFILHALGDTIGFKNGDWEFNYNKQTTLDSILEFVSEFIELGGVNGIDLKNWMISDDTLYHIAMGISLLHFRGSNDEKFIRIVKDSLIMTYNRIEYENRYLNLKRYPGNTTNKYISKFTENDQDDARYFPYDSMSGGNGVAMRNLCIGLAFFEENMLDTLVDISITLGKLTHNSAYGYLGGLTSSYFVSLAIRNVQIDRWPFMLLNLIESELVKKYVNYSNSDELIDYVTYIRYWRKYVDTKFVDGKPIKVRIFSNLTFRTKYYFENFVKDSNFEVIGASGFCATIMAYDCLLDCDGKWEKVIFYAILNPGDSDTVGAITGGLFGAVYGFSDVPEKMLEHLEEKQMLEDLGKKMFKRFFLGEEVEIPQIEDPKPKIMKLMRTIKRLKKR